MRPFVPTPGDKETTIARLRGELETAASAGRATKAPLSTGWPETDAMLSGGLSNGGLHEWFGLSLETHAQRCEARSSLTSWTPPIGLFVHLAAQGQRASESDVSATSRSSVVLWIGRKVWPYGHALVRTHSALFASSICVDAQRQDERFWSIDVALRSAGAGAVVIADGSGLSLAISRRLQLAAEAGGSLAFLARPPWEERELSAATTRWRVRTLVSSGEAQRWSLELVRCKGSHAHTGHAQTWTLERTDDGRVVSVPSFLVNRSTAPALAS